MQAIKAADIATARKLAEPPHLIMRMRMRIMNRLFQKKLDPVAQDPERLCSKPSSGESLKVNVIHRNTNTDKRYVQVGQKTGLFFDS